MPGMRFADFKPVQIDDAGHVLEQLEPGAPDFWSELAVEAFAVLRAHPATQGVAAKDVACCAIAAVYQIVTEFGGDSHYLPSPDKALLTSMKESRRYEAC